MRQIDAVLSHSSGHLSFDASESSLSLLKQKLHKQMIHSQEVQKEDAEDFAETVTNPKHGANEVNYELKIELRDTTMPEDVVLPKKASKDRIGDVSNKQWLGKEQKVSRRINDKRHDHTAMKKIEKEWRFINGISCNKCRKVFQTKGEFDSHYRNMHKEPTMYTCSICYKTIAKYSSYRSHCYRHVIDQRYKCQECSKSFGLQTQLNDHVRSKHKQEKPYKCDNCGRNFVTKPGLALHVKKHQEDLKEDFTCQECGKVLLTRGGLTTHMNAHRQGRRFMCDVCGKTFTQKINMQQHVKQHTGDKPFICDQCGNTFTDRTQLARHYSRHSTKRPFKCEACGKMYKTERCLKVHTQVHATERPYRCAYCNKGFLNRTKLKQHHNIHTGERPFACKFCERKFTNYPNWLKHTRRRHSEASSPKKMMSATAEAAEALNTSTSMNNQLNPVLTAVFGLSSNSSLLPMSCTPNSSVNQKTDTCLEALAFPFSPSATAPSITQIVQIPEFVPADYQPLAGQILNNHFLDDVGSIGDTLPDLLPHLEPSEAVHHDSLTTDFKLSKTDELYLQKSILNFPMTEMNVNGESSDSHLTNVECSLISQIANDVNLHVEGQFLSGLPDFYEEYPSGQSRMQYDLVPS